MTTLQIRWNVDELLAPFNMRGSQSVVTSLSQDSREQQHNSLFVARNGGSHLGSDFAHQAVSKGASVVLLQGSKEQAKALAKALSVDVIAWDPAKLSLGKLANRFYNEPSKKMGLVGITGTNGKTSCVHFLVQLLSLLGKKTAMMGTLGWGFLDNLSPSSHTTLDPITLQRRLAELEADGVGMVVMEVSSHAIDQGRVECIDFDLAAYTNLSRDHLDYHGSMSVYANTKARFFRECGIPQQLLNADDAHVSELLDEDTNAHRVSFSANGERSWARVDAYRCGSTGIHLTVEVDREVVNVTVPVMGHFNVSNVLLVIAAACQLGYPLSLIAPKMSHIKSVPGRMEVVTANDQPTIIVDYAHTPDALEKALLACREHSTGLIKVLFGCGGDRDQGKRAMMAAVAEQWADEVWVTSDNPRTENPQSIIDQIMSGFKKPEHVHQIVGRADAIDHIVRHAQLGDVVLLAGKGHEHYQEINGERLPFSDQVQSLKALERGGVF